MRPTRWTKQKRVTYYGKGGYTLLRYGVDYTNPVTGNGWYMDWKNFFKRKVLRRAR